MSKATLLYRHEKNCWRVDLMSDGTLWVSGFFLRKQASVSHIEVGMPATGITYLPRYVQAMVAGAQEEWRYYVDSQE